MQYHFVAMQEEYANEIIEDWHYGGICAFYDMAADEEDSEIFANRTYWENTTFAVLNLREELVGWASFFTEGDDIWLSLGLKPELTGRGLGEKCVSDCTLFAKSHYGLDKQAIKLEVALFNKRAIKVYKKAGFIELGKAKKSTHLGDMEFLQMQHVIPGRVAKVQ
jgi:ribosomal-protein-alanine N-acetyltransferase